jgi:hypothetical protein
MVVRQRSAIPDLYQANIRPALDFFSNSEKELLLA